MRSTLYGLGVAVALAWAASSASAAVIAGEDFNGLTPPDATAVTGFTPNFISTGTLSYTVTSVVSSPGDNALQMAVNLPTGIAWWGLTWGSNWHGNTNAGGTNYPLSAITLGFDAQAVGLTSGAISFGVSDQTNTLAGSFNVTSTWQHYSATLDTLTPGGSNTGPFNPTTSFFVFSPGFGQGGFGTAVGTHALLLDNITLSVVPEPASLGLLGLGALALLRRR